MMAIDIFIMRLPVRLLFISDLYSIWFVQSRTDIRASLCDYAHGAQMWDKVEEKKING